MLRLKLWIGMGNQRARLAQPKAQRPKESLALPHPQGNAEVLLNPGRQSLSIPDSSCQGKIFWALAESLRELDELLLIKPCRSARSLPIDQASQALLFKAMDPILNSASSITQKMGHLTATQSMRNQQQSVKPVVVSCLSRTTDLILQGEDHGLSIGKPEFLHAPRVLRVSVMRNYL